MKKTISRQPKLVGKIVLRNRIAAGVLVTAGIITLGMLIAKPAHTSTTGPVPVQVTNTPLPNSDVDNAARHSVQFLLQPDTYGTGSTEASESITVPAGKRLVIEYVSAELGTGYGDVTMETYSGGNLAPYYFIENTNIHKHSFFPTRIYADPGTSVTIFVDSRDGSRVYGDVEISGYYVNI